MTSEDIVTLWLLVPSNREKLITIEYDKTVFDFIVNTMECRSFGADYLPVYKVGNTWQRIVCE